MTSRTPGHSASIRREVTDRLMPGLPEPLRWALDCARSCEEAIGPLVGFLYWSGDDPQDPARFVLEEDPGRADLGHLVGFVVSAAQSPAHFVLCALDANRWAIAYSARGDRFDGECQAVFDCQPSETTRALDWMRGQLGLEPLGSSGPRAH